MGARILELAEAVAERHRRADGLALTPGVGDHVPEIDRAVAFWRGASGTAYVHTIFPVIGCPELPRANYVLVRRRHDGEAQVLRIGCTIHDCATLNLAELRHRAAKLGANEVHVHFLASDASAREAVNCDLMRALLAPANANTPPTRTVH